MSNAFAVTYAMTKTYYDYVTR